MQPPRLLVVIGTRPEAIKLAPLICAARERRDVEAIVCVTGQHRDMVDAVLSFFGLRAEHELNVMRANQGLADLAAAIMSGMAAVLGQTRPSAVVVQGDTTTALAAAVAAFYSQIPVAHVEAGLRSHNLASPFPEEGNRALISHLARWHFAPTEGARANLEREGLTEGVFVVGNTGVDALLSTIAISRSRDSEYSHRYSFLVPERPLILVTGHRRESFGEPFRDMCRAIRSLASERAVQVVYPVHLNPNVRAPVEDILRGCPDVHLIEPVDYPEMVWLMARSTLILTDSGGIQEEAPSLAKPVLVMRHVTERREGVEAGCAVLVGTSTESIVNAVGALLDDPDRYAAMASSSNPYGDGTSSKRILEILSAELPAR